MTDIDRNVIPGTEAPQEKEPTYQSSGRKRQRSAPKSASARVEDAKSSPRPKQTPIPKATPKVVETLTVTGFDVAQWLMPAPKHTDLGQPIWPIDKTDQVDVENLRAFCDNTAALINRLPERYRRLIMGSVSGASIGGEIVGAFKGLYVLIMSRQFLVQMASAPVPAPAPEEATTPFPGQAWTTEAAD